MLISIITFLDTFAVGVVNAIYPTLVQSKLLGATLFACIMSAANAAALIGSTYYGRLSDVNGRRTAILASLCTTFFGFALYVAGFACDGYLLLASARMVLPAAGRVISGMGRAALASPVLALLADHADGDAMTMHATTTTRVVATFGFGYAIGSAVGGFLVDVGGPWLNLSLISTCSVVEIACAWHLPRQATSSGAKVLPAAAATASKAAGGLPAGGNSGKPDASTWVTTLYAALAVPTTRALLLLQGLAAASFHVYDSTSAIYVQDALGYSASQRGYIHSYAGWMFALMTHFAVPVIVTCARPQLLLCTALLCTAVGRFGLAAASRLSLPTLSIVCSYPILNLGQGMTHTMLKALMATAAGAEDLGLLLGVLGSVEKGFGVLGPLLGGPAYDRLGPAAPACLSAMLAIVGCATAALVDVEKTKPEAVKRRKKVD